MSVGLVTPSAYVPWIVNLRSAKVATPATALTVVVPVSTAPAGAPWINSAPLTTAGLRGRVVLVEFWTYG